MGIVSVNYFIVRFGGLKIFLALFFGRNLMLEILKRGRGGYVLELVSEKSEFL